MGLIGEAIYYLLLITAIIVLIGENPVAVYGGILESIWNGLVDAIINDTFGGLL